MRCNNVCIRFGKWKVRRLNQSRSKVTPKAKFPAGLGEKNGWAVPNWFRRRTFHALISMYEVRLVKRSATEPCLNLSYKEEGYLKGNRTLFLKKSLVEWLSRENNAKHQSARKFTSLQQVPPISTKLHQSALNCTTLHQVTPNSSNLR